MKIGIIGLPQVGKTSLFKILTKAKLEQHGYSNPREAHIGVARVPDERLEKLSALYSPKKTTFASVEYVRRATGSSRSVVDRGDSMLSLRRRSLPGSQRSASP